MREILNIKEKIMSNLLQLSAFTIDTSRIIFIDWLTTRDYGYCKTGILIKCTNGEIFLPSNGMYFEEDKDALILAMGRLKEE